MTNEQIEKAAKGYADSIAQSDVKKLYCVDDFIAGAEWRINSVWHTVEDMPSDGMNGKGVGELCLIKNDKGDVEFVQARYEHTNGVYYFMAYSGIVELHNVVRWAYIKDLLP